MEEPPALNHEENQLLCRVEGKAPMGQLMRRHWVPALLSEQLVENDGAPVKIRLFGEDLVAFRDMDGRIGVLGEYCPHRKSSLALRRNEECGLRSLYQGWKFEVDGNVVEVCAQRGLGFLLMQALGLHNMDLIMALTLLILLFAVLASMALLACDRALRHGS